VTSLPVYDVVKIGATDAEAARLGPGGITNQTDYYSGKGSTGPTILPVNITGWWYIHQ
jgi:hypothetical protein